MFKKGRATVANKSIFKSAPKGKTVPAATHTNRAGGLAYKLGEKAALAQYAATGTFNDTFYSTGVAQVEEVLTLLPKVDVEFIAKTAMYTHEQGRMKDMPALLAAHLATRGDEGRTVLKMVFPVVVSNGKMLRNFAQIVRSGVTGRKSFGTSIKNMIHGWFASKTPDDIFRMSTGNDPSIGDILTMTHLSDNKSPERKALYQYLKDVDHDADSLPLLVRDYLKFKNDPTKWEAALPKVPFEMLMGLTLSDAQWSALGQQMSWTQLRMNLNTLSRHGVFKNDGIARTLASKMKDPELIRKAKPFPYQLLVTYLNTAESGPEAVPRVIRNALHDALDVATELVPSIEGPGHALIDVSGSMQSPVSGYREGATSKATCVQVAAMIGSAFLRKNQESSIIAYSDSAITNHGCEPRDSVMTNAQRLASIGGGGTNLSAAFRELNRAKAKGNLVVVASDMETWMDTNDKSVPRLPWHDDGTVPAKEWAEYKARNPNAKLVCINLQAADHCQVTNSPDVLNIGGFSDTLWEVIRSFVEGVPSSDHWVKVIESITLPARA
jgi:60 kDa SS-A/Ro ribonucleoprotein